MTAQEFRGLYEDILEEASPGLRFAKAFLMALDACDLLQDPSTLDSFLAPDAIMQFKIGDGPILDPQGYQMYTFPTGYQVLSIRKELIVGYTRLADRELTTDSPFDSTDAAVLDKRLVTRSSQHTQEDIGARDYAGDLVVDDFLMTLVPAGPGHGFAGYQVQHLQIAFNSLF